MMWFLLPLFIGFAIGMIGFIAKKYNYRLFALGMLLMLCSIPVNLLFDGLQPIPQNICLKCKLQTDSSFYAIGCDNKIYELKMIDWVNLNTSVCK